MVRERANTHWREAVDLANAYLASSERHSLPPGYYELSDEDGMTFVTGDERWPIRVWKAWASRVSGAWPCPCATTWTPIRA